MYHLLFKLLVCSVFVAATSASIPDYENLTDDQLWDEADFVGIVKIQEGQHRPGKAYELQASVELVMKGSAGESIKFFNRIPSSAYAKELGNIYLLYLRYNDYGQLEVIRENHSIIEMVPRQREDLKFAIEFISEKYGIVYAQHLEADGQIWWVYCPPLYSETYCKEKASAARTAFKKYKGL